jgi:hypothetical protein
MISGATLGSGAIDLTINARGRTAGEIRHHIAERFGMPDEEAGGLVDRLLHLLPPPALVIDGVDSAERPEELIGELVAPLAARARRRGIRLLLGFAGRLPANLPYEVLLESKPLSGTPHGSADPGAVRQLLRKLASAEEDLAMLYADVSSRVATGHRPLPGLAPWLRVRYAVSAGERPPTPELSLIQDCAEAALADILRLCDRLEELKRQHGDLGMRLEVWRERAERCFGAEDRQLSLLYGTAYETLRSGPCDLRAARAALDTYVSAVERRMGKDRGR